jgi:PAS domain S-box-containing protein
VVIEDRDGRLWARGIHHVSAREPDAARFRANQPPGLSEQKFLAIGLALDGRGRVLTDSPSGMARWDGAAWREFTAANGFPAAVSHIGKPDADGNLWLGVEGHGLWRWLGYDDFESWTSSEGFSDLAGFGIARTSATRLVVGLDHGCQAFDEQRRRFEDCPFGPLDGLTVVPVSRGSDGAIWLGSESGTIWRARPGEPATPVATLPPGHLTSVDADERGTWWISSEAGGLVTLDAATAQVRQVELPAAAGFPYETAAVNASERCVATEFGLVRIRGEDIAFFPFARDGRPAGFRSLAVAADGTVWAASTAVGLLRITGCHGDGAQWVASDLVDPTVVYTVRTDRRGWVWAGTDHGLAVFDGRTWRRADVSDGLVWNDTDQNGLLADTDGSMWITTPKGVSHLLDPERWVARQSRPLDVALVSARFGDQRLDGAGAARVAWQPDTGFEARLTSHSHDRGARTQYQYRLVGLADQWSTARTPDINLPALEPGRYRLEARLSDPDHARTSPTIALGFEIVPPWWRTGPFFALAALAGLAAVAAGVRQVLRRRTRLLHEQNEASFRRVIDLMPDLISMTRDGALVYTNRASRQFHGEHYGAIDAVHPDDRAKVFDQHRSVRDAGSGPELLEARIRANDGSWRTCELSAIRAEFAGATTVITSARDITERKRIGAKLMVADRMTSLGTLAAGIAHEINNPLAFVIGNLEAMAETIAALTIAERAELAAQLHDARDGADRVRAIVRGLRAFTRSEEDTRVPLSLDDVLEAATRLTGNELRHRAQLVREAGPVPRVVADHGRLTQVFINLLVNAAHAIPEGHADHNRITVRTRTDDNGHAVVEVEDTGAGMAPDVQARAFEPFFTTKDVGVGSGLGLSICHGIITGLGGQIAIASEPGRGTSVRIALPPHRDLAEPAAAATAAVPAQLASAASPAPAPAPPVHRLQVMVVDDEPQIAQVVGRLLRRDYEVTIAECGQDALDHITRGARFDAIVCDVMMPNMTGIELVEELRRIAPDQARRLMFLSGGVFTADTRERLERIGALQLEKPVGARQLREAVLRMGSTRGER